MADADLLTLRSNRKKTLPDQAKVVTATKDASEETASTPSGQGIMPAQATTSAPAVPMKLMFQMISQMMSKISDMVVTIKWNDAETMMEMQAA